MPSSGRLLAAILLTSASRCTHGLVSTSATLQQNGPPPPKKTTTKISPLTEEPQYNPMDYQSLPTTQKDVCIIGAGPVGLATAIMLSSPPHNYHCVVIEANVDVNNFNPGRGFMYNVNSRGRKFTQMFPGVDAKLVEMGVESDFGRLCVIPSDPNEALPEVAHTASITLDSDDDDKINHKEGIDLNGKVNPAINKVIKSSQEKGGLGKKSYWIQRHDLTRLLRDYCLEENSKNSRDKVKAERGSVEIVSGSKCVNVFPSSTNDTLPSGRGGGGAEALIENLKTGDITKYRCNLVVGADGYRSKVRSFLMKNDASEGSLHQSKLWEKIPSRKFLVKKFKSPATHLRLKVLQFPPKFPIPDNDNNEIKTNGEYIYAIKSKNNGPKDFISFGILPIKDNDAIRPVNVIARPNHDLWKINDPEEVREWFQSSFPRMNFDSENGLLSKKEWERFVEEEGTRFPHCQFTNGVSTSSVDKQSAVVLVGDALHSYPPDIGQGVNSGLSDVVELGKALENVDLSVEGNKKTKDISLGDAMKKFETNRLAETKALIRLARFGSPYQYSQPLYIDRIGKKLWTFNVLIRVLLNKASFGLIPQPAIMLSQDSDLSFKQVMFRADLVTFGLGTFASWLLKKIFWQRLLNTLSPLL